MEIFKCGIPLSDRDAVFVVARCECHVTVCVELSNLINSLLIAFWTKMTHSVVLVLMIVVESGFVAGMECQVAFG
jgi:hypothetical protein